MKLYISKSFADSLKDMIYEYYLIMPGCHLDSYTYKENLHIGMKLGILIKLGILVDFMLKLTDMKYQRPPISGLN